MKEALFALEEGGYAEALARTGALINRDDERIPLSRLELRRDLAQDYAEFLPAVPRDQALPRLLADPADRDRLVKLIGRLLGDDRMRARAHAHP